MDKLGNESIRQLRKDLVDGINSDTTAAMGALDKLIMAAIDARTALGAPINAVHTNSVMGFLRQPYTDALQSVARAAGRQEVLHTLDFLLKQEQEGVE